MVVNAEKKMAVLCELSTCRPVRYRLCEPVHDEDTEVVANTKDERREDDVDDIKLNPEQPHQPQYDDPANRHRQETHQGEFDASVATPAARGK